MYPQKNKEPLFVILSLLQEYSSLQAQSKK